MLWTRYYFRINRCCSNFGRTSQSRLYRRFLPFQGVPRQVMSSFMLSLHFSALTLDLDLDARGITLKPCENDLYGKAAQYIIAQIAGAYVAALIVYGSYKQQLDAIFEELSAGGPLTAPLLFTNKGVASFFSFFQLHLLLN